MAVETEIYWCVHQKWISKSALYSYKYRIECLFQRWYSYINLLSFHFQMTYEKNIMLSDSVGIHYKVVEKPGQNFCEKE